MSICHELYQQQPSAGRPSEELAALREKRVLLSQGPAGPQGRTCRVYVGDPARKRHHPLSALGLCTGERHGTEVQVDIGWTQRTHALTCEATQTCAACRASTRVCVTGCEACTAKGSLEPEFKGIQEEPQGSRGAEQPPRQLGATGAGRNPRE